MKDLIPAYWPLVEGPQVWAAVFFGLSFIFWY